MEVHHPRSDVRAPWSDAGRGGPISYVRRGRSDPGLRRARGSLACVACRPPRGSRRPPEPPCRSHLGAGRAARRLVRGRSPLAPGALAEAAERSPGPGARLQLRDLRGRIGRCGSLVSRAAASARWGRSSDRARGAVGRRRRGGVRLARVARVSARAARPGAGGRASRASPARSRRRGFCSGSRPTGFRSTWSRPAS